MSMVFGRQLSLWAFVVVGVCVSELAAASNSTSFAFQESSSSGNQNSTVEIGGIVINADSTATRYIKYIFAALSILASILITFAGYKMIYPVLFIAAFYMGAMFSYDFILQLSSSADGALVAFFIGGIIAAILVLYFYDVGIFAVGAVAGGSLGFLVDATFLHGISPEHHEYVHYASVIIFAVIGGIASLYLEKPALVVATAFFGSTIFIGAMGHFIGGYPSNDELNGMMKKGEHDWTSSVPNSWWGYLISNIILFLLGAYVQFKHTARNIDHIRGNSGEKIPLRSNYRSV